MNTIRVAVNGAGRIGRAFIRSAHAVDNIEIVAVNDLAPVENIAYLLQYDSVYGQAPFSVEAKEGQRNMTIDGKEVAFFSEKDPKLLPWKDLDIDVVVESTGVFTKYEDARAHIEAGAKRIVISAPAKSEPKDETEATVLMGVNHNVLANCQISSNGSCTTNAGSPIISILHEALGIEKALLNTVHAYTSTQEIVDSLSPKDFRKGRAGALNIIPTSTGAAIATTKVITDLEGKFDGVALRVPVSAGSIADVTMVTSKETDVDSIKEILTKASQEEKWSQIMKVSEDPIVSSDVIGQPYGAIIDLPMTRVAGGNLVKVLSWYDNEYGYTHTLVQHVLETGKYIK